jgi:hypothetical protein
MKLEVAAIKILMKVGVTNSLSWLIYEFLILKVPILQTLMGVKRQANKLGSSSQKKKINP